ADLGEELLLRRRDVGGNLTAGAALGELVHRQHEREVHDGCDDEEVDGAWMIAPMPIEAVSKRPGNSMTQPERLPVGTNAPSSGLTMLSTNAVTIAPNAPPMTTATASSTTLPRMTNSLKPWNMFPLRKVPAGLPGRCRQLEADDDDDAADDAPAPADARESVR